MHVTNEHFDIIGDLHGYADSLRELLLKLGYQPEAGVFGHPQRRAIFVGDFVDRGPKIRETLQIVRAMVENGSALAVMGNHEWNAIRFHTRGADGSPLRAHSKKNMQQHQATLDQIALPDPVEWDGWLEWFKTLPLYLDLGGLRVVHAAWCTRSIGLLGSHRFTDPHWLQEACNPGTGQFHAISAVLNGPELPLPEGHCFHDHSGRVRSEIRVRWFDHPVPGQKATYRGMVFPASQQVPETEIDAETLARVPCYGEAEPPVVFGHYWMPPTTPRCLAPNAVCVDYSVASPKGGLLTAYRWSGENHLCDAHLVTVRRD